MDDVRADLPVPTGIVDRAAAGARLTLDVLVTPLAIVVNHIALVRPTLSFSKTLENHIGAIRYFICHYNLTRARALLV